MNNVITIIALIAFCGFLFLYFALGRLIDGPSGLEKPKDFNEQKGRFQVVFPDGNTSAIMCWDTALQHQEIYGGEIVKVKRSSWFS